MIENIKYFPVNWVEGMKINKNHFIDLQSFVEDFVRDARNQVTNELNYGFLTPANTTPFVYSVSIDAHNELSVDIKTLKALTPGGGRIEISDYTNPFHQKLVLTDFLQSENTHFLMLNVSPLERIPLGEQNMEEIPPRFPYTTPKYFLTTLTESEVISNRVGSLQIPLAKFKISEGKVEISNTYIPPCTYINNHDSLRLLFEKQDNFFKQLEFYCIQIVQKIKYRNSSEDENVIANMTLQMCDRILQYVEKEITTNKWKRFQLTPFDLLVSIVNLARTVKNGFDCFSGDGKETLFNYYSEWTDTKSGDYEKFLLDTINIEFKNFDVEPTVNQSIIFIDKIEKLFTILNQLDYIGRKKDTGIFVNENVLKTDKLDSTIFKSEETKEKTQSSNSPSFLAD